MNQIRKKSRNQAVKKLRRQSFKESRNASNNQGQINEDMEKNIKEAKEGEQEQCNKKNNRTTTRYYNNNNNSNSNSNSNNNNKKKRSKTPFAVTVGAAFDRSRDQASLRLGSASERINLRTFRIPKQTSAPQSFLQPQCLIFLLQKELYGTAKKDLLKHAN